MAHCARSARVPCNMEGLLSALTWAAAGLVLLLVLAFAALAAWAYCGFKPKPTPGKLKNGMEIKQLQQYETDFLDKEIFQDACYRTGADFQRCCCSAPHPARHAACRPAHCVAGIIKFKAGDTIVDAGANIGLFSLWALQECGGDARILSFEPMPTTFACLAANAEKHGAGGKIKACVSGCKAAHAHSSLTASAPPPCSDSTWVCQMLMLRSRLTTTPS